MRGLVLAVALVLLAGPALAQEIVIFDSWAYPYGNATPARDAGAMLGANVKGYVSGEEGLWMADMQDGADIVVFDVCSNYTLGAPAPGQMQILSQQLDAMYAFLVEHPCTIGIVAFWGMAYEPGPIWSFFDVQWCWDVQPDPIPLYQWNATHQIFAGVPDPVMNQEVGWYLDGSAVEPTGGGTAIAGFTRSPSACYAGLVVGDDLRTYYIGETGAGGFPDSDYDGTRDWTEMYYNIYTYALSVNPSATEPATWGALKGLYR